LLVKGTLLSSIILCAHKIEKTYPTVRESSRILCALKKLQKRGKGTDLVYFEDRGSIYDAPIDVFWDYMLKDNEYHSRAHHSTLRNMKWKDLNEITGEGTCEVMRGGKWSKMRFRMTTIPPFTRIHEEFAGRYAGRKMVFLYTPKGRRTAVDVFVLAPRSVVEETLQNLAQADKEDAPMVRAYSRSRR
jgi:hypothetical protein